MSKHGRMFLLQQSAFGKSDPDGSLQDDISLLEVSCDRASGNGCYAMRMQPGATTAAKFTAERRTS